MMLRVLAAAVAAAMIAGPAAAVTGAFGTWLVSDTAGRVSASTPSAAGARLVVGCAHGQRVLFVAYPEAVALEDAVAVRWRVDDKPVRAERWPVGEDRASLTADPALFRSLAAASRFWIEARGRLDVFDLAGVRRVAALMEPCRAD